MHVTRDVSPNLLPTNTSSNYTQRLISDLILLVHHKKVGRSRFRTERFLAMVNGPLESLSRDKDLAKTSIDTGLARVQTGDGRDVVLVSQDPSTQMG